MRKQLDTGKTMGFAYLQAQSSSQRQKNVYSDRLESF
jgi:hypothetical protein